MDSDARKALVRHIRSKAVQFLPSITEEAFELGRLTAMLLPDWADSEYPDLEGFLFHACGFREGMSARLAMLAIAYSEVPSLEIWKTVGFTKVARASTLPRDLKIEMLLSAGAEPLDLLCLG